MSHAQYLCWTTCKHHPPPHLSPTQAFFFFPFHHNSCCCVLLLPPPHPPSLNIFSVCILPFAPCCPSLLLPVIHNCLCDSGREPSAGCRRQHQDCRLRLQQRVHTGQQTGHVLWLATLCCARAFPGQKI